MLHQILLSAGTQCAPLSPAPLTAFGILQPWSKQRSTRFLGSRRLRENYGSNTVQTDHRIVQCPLPCALSAFNLLIFPMQNSSGIVGSLHCWPVGISCHPMEGSELLQLWEGKSTRPTDQPLYKLGTVWAPCTAAAGLSPSLQALSLPCQQLCPFLPAHCQGRVGLLWWGNVGPWSWWKRGALYIAERASSTMEPAPKERVSLGDNCTYPGSLRDSSGWPICCVLWEW